MYTKNPNNPMEAIKASRDQQNFIEKAKETFSKQSYYKEYKGLNNASKFTSYFIPLFSICTGASFLYMVLSEQLNYILAIFFSIVLIVLLEWFKNYLLSKSFKNMFKKGTRFIYLLAPTLLLCILSIVLSIQGIKSIERYNYDNKINLSESIYKYKLDSVNSYYDEKEEAEKQHLQDFKKTVTYKGKIDIHNKAVKTAVLMSQENIQLIQDQRSKALLNLEKKHHEKKEAAAPLRLINKYALYIITITIELLIIASCFFPFWYKFKTLDEIELLSGEHEKIIVTVNGIKHLLNTYGIAQNNIPFKAHNIGFSNSQNVDSDNSNKENVSINNNTYTSIDEAIKAGVTDRRELTKYGYSINQVNEKLNYYLNNK